MNTKSFIDALGSGHGEIEEMAPERWMVGPHIVGYDADANFLTVYAVHDIPLADQDEQLIATVLHHLNRKFPATKVTVRSGHVVISHETFTSSVADLDQRFRLIEVALHQTYQGLVRLLGIE